MKSGILSYFSFLLLVITVSCKKAEEINPLEIALASESPKIKRVIDHLDQHEVQIKFTQIDRKGKQLIFTDYDFQVNDNQYFYPASTVKLPAALISLQKLNTLDSIHLDTKFYVEGDSLETTFAKEISKIFAVSDNMANNRLVEFLGQDAINQGIMEKGSGEIRFAHRLSTQNADDITTKPLVFYSNDSTTHITNPIANAPIEPLNLEGIEKGHGYYSDDLLIEEPFDFSLKNHYPINTQHNVLKRIIFPNAFPKNERYDLSEAQWRFLKESMRMLPKEMGYDTEKYYDSYVKFLIFGDVTQSMPDYINVYNKVGYAYGTLTDCAYIEDTKNGIDFMVTATILVNQDGIFNDDAYEYDEVGIPFLAQLGRELYQIELKRSR